MKTRLVLLLAVCLVMGFAALGFAEEYGPGGGMPDTTAPTGPMMNAPGAEVIPGLMGNESERFNADSLAAAQAVCDNVATQNNKMKCAARPIEVTGTTEPVPNVFYCICE